MRIDYIPASILRTGSVEKAFRADDALAASITKAASKQTYYTIRFLVDRERVHDAFSAYAYFRWVDDWLDQQVSSRAERLAFLERQQSLINCCYEGSPVYGLLPEEELLASLIQSDVGENTGLHTYIRNLMAVMEFDANRRGRLISQEELGEYSCHLAIGVTEALHYFIGYDDAPRTEARYSAVTGAHIAHMLRDTFEDADAGYFNIPWEFLNAHRLDPCDIQSGAYQEWVTSRVYLARSYFEAGKGYLAQVKSQRCRLAGYAYIARFEGVLDTIEREGYCLRAQYLERKSLRGGLKMGRSAITMLINPSIRGTT